MATTSISLSNISTVAKQMAPKVFRSNLDVESSLIGRGALKKETQVKGSKYVANIYTPGSAGSGFVADRGRLPEGTSATPIQATQMPKNFVDKISVGAIAGEFMTSEQSGLTMLRQEMQNRMRHASRQIARAIHGSGIAPLAAATWSGTASGSTVTFETADPGQFVLNALYDIGDVSETKSWRVRCTGKTLKAVTGVTYGAEIILTNDVVNPATGSVVALDNTSLATGDTIYQAGALPGFGGNATLTGDIPTSFDALCGSGATAAALGITPSSYPEYNFAGFTKAHNAVASHDAAMIFLSQVAQNGGAKVDVATCDPILADALNIQAGNQTAVAGASAATGVGVRQVQNDGDKYGAEGVQRLRGRVLVDDDFAMKGRLVAFDSRSTKLGVWREAEFREDSKGADVFVNQTYLSDESQILTSINLVTDNRASCGSLTGVTSL